jgi:hypothetical protein
MAGTQQQKGGRPTWVNFMTGASAALSGWMFVHPFDLLKVSSEELCLIAAPVS